MATPTDDGDLDPSYLVMTAADCASYNRSNPHPIVSLNQLLEERALYQGKEICVGFVDRLEGDFFICRSSSASRLSSAFAKVVTRQGDRRIVVETD
jgi:hypothetical protein